MVSRDRQHQTRLQRLSRGSLLDTSFFLHFQILTYWVFEARCLAARGNHLRVLYTNSKRKLRLQILINIAPNNNVEKRYLLHLLILKTSCPFYVILYVVHYIAC
jgi:hypothetical protein